MRAHLRGASVVVVLAGGCQLVSGLNGIQPGATGTGGAGGATSASVGDVVSASTVGSTGSTGGAGGVMGGTDVSGSGTGSGGTGGSPMMGSSSSGTCTTDDVHNCGACGHDCGGGACINGVCKPYVLVPAPSASADFPTSLASDGTFLYWSVPGPSGSASGKFSRVNLAGTASISPLGLLGRPAQLAIAGGFLSWIDLGSGTPAIPSIGLVRLNPMGLSGAFVELKNNVPAGLQAFPGDVVWNVPGATHLAFGNPVNAEQMSVPPDAFLDLSAQATSFCADGDSVFWTDGVAIYRHLFPMNPVENATNADQIYAIAEVKNLAADGTPGGKLYWTLPDGVKRGNKLGTTPSDMTGLATSPNPDQLLVDDTHVYWTASDNVDTGCSGSPQVYRTPITGPTAGTPVQVAPLAGCAVLAQDAQNLFWIDAGAIHRWVK